MFKTSLHTPPALIYNTLYMKNKFNKGFTLIELLVVIAIIGLLSSIVLASLSSARDKAKEAKILSSLKSINTQAEIYRIDNNTYEGLCQDSKISEMVSALDASSEGADCWVSTYTDYRTELRPIDYGVGATVNEIYYGADPTGTFTFDTANTGGAVTWANAGLACSGINKRLPGPSVLRAIYNIGNTTPTGFAASLYWSYLGSPSGPSSAYRTLLFNGLVHWGDKSNGICSLCPLAFA